MLNILKKKCNINNRSKESISEIDEINSNIGYNRHFSPANKEWSSSVYAYNKNYSKSLPMYNLITTNLIKSYFNLYNPKDDRKTEVKMSRRMRIRLKRISINQVFVNKAELKHTNSKIVVTSNIFNAKEKSLQKKLQRVDYIGLFERNLEKSKQRTNMLTLRTIKWWQNRNEVISQLRKNISYYLLEKGKQRLSNKHFKLFKVFCSMALPKYKYVLKRLNKRERSIKYIKNLILFQKSKFNADKTHLLKRLINKIYGKSTELNLINLKYIFLNSDIVAESINIKLKKRKSTPLRVLRALLKKIELPIINKFETYDPSIFYKKSLLKKIKGFDLNPFFLYKILNNSNDNKDSLNQLLQEIYKESDNREIFNTIEYKAINGIKVEASGRISKRLTASRSLSKAKHKGSLKDVNSSDRGLSSVMLRNHVKSNIQYSKESYKTRNGSYGLKVSISSK